MEIKETKFGILGMAKSGIAAAHKIKELGGNPFISEYKKEDQIDNSQQIKQDFNCEFGGHSDKILESDIIIISPGIPLNIPIIQKAKQKNIKLISEIEFGFQIKHPESRIIAVTGSNGKSTTVSLIHHILQTAGYNSILAGNIGTAFTSYPIEKPEIDFIVLELSSFQLDLIGQFRPDVAAILNITPDHLNRYNSFEDYALAKFNIFKNQQKNDIAILNADDSVINKFKDNINSSCQYFSLNSATDIYFDGEFINYNGELISMQETRLSGPHNTANIMASLLAVSPFGIKTETIRKSLKTFSSLTHRLEYVTEINGINFINDSKATNTDSVKYALQSFDRPIRIIMGGAGKGEDYTILNPLLKKFAKKIYLIGESRFEMKNAFTNIAPLELYNGFQEVISAAYAEAETGDYIVLSPACASYDMFNNFEQRGDKFKQIVMDLKK